MDHESAIKYYYIIIIIIKTGEWINESQNKSVTWWHDRLHKQADLFRWS